MILMFVPLLALLVGLVLGGRSTHLRTLPIRWTGLVLVAFGAQWLLVHLADQVPTALLGLAFLLSHAAVVGWFLRNRRLPGLSLALAGAVLNCAVLTAHAGFMPVTQSALSVAGLASPRLEIGQHLPRSKDVVVAATGDAWSILGDSLAVAQPVRLVFSPGDVLIALGLGTLVLVSTRPRLRGLRRAYAVPKEPSSRPEPA